MNNGLDRLRDDIFVPVYSRGYDFLEYLSIDEGSLVQPLRLECGSPSLMPMKLLGRRRI